MSRTIKANPNFSDMSLILHNATLMGQHKNKKFLSKLIDDKHLSFEGVSNSSDFSKIKSDFFAILDLFEAKYKDQGDLDFYFDGAREQFTPYFKVLYPKFTITNSQGKTHEIRDLFVFHNFKWSNNAIHPYKLEGGRFSKTKLEALSGYQQSHLGSHGSWLSTPFYCSYFCVGGDTDVSRMLAEFSVEMDIDRYELFLFCVDSMITWESLEGVPFIRMENIKNADSYRVTSISGRMVERVVNTILSDKITLDVDFYISGGMYRIHPNTRASNFIKDVILRYFSFSDYKTLLVSKVPNTYNHYLAMKAENAATSNTIEIVAKEEYTIFRGKKIYPKIIKEDARLLKPVSIEDHIVYPNFLENVIRKLESRIYEKAVVKSATKLYHTSNNAQRSVVSDTVSL